MFPFSYFFMATFVFPSSPFSFLSPFYPISISIFFSSLLPSLSSFSSFPSAFPFLFFALTNFASSSIHQSVNPSLSPFPPHYCDPYLIHTILPRLSSSTHPRSLIVNLIHSFVPVVVCYIYSISGICSFTL